MCVCVCVVLTVVSLERIDIFSFGMVLCELLSGKSPSMSNFKRVIPGFGLDKDEIRAKALEGAPAEFVNMAIQCTEAEADHRPTLVDAITYLKDAYKEAANEELVDVKDEGEVLIQQFDDLVIELPTTPTKEETPEPPSPAAAVCLSFFLIYLLKTNENSPAAIAASAQRHRLNKGHKGAAGQERPRGHGSVAADGRVTRQRPPMGLFPQRVSVEDQGTTSNGIL